MLCTLRTAAGLFDLGHMGQLRVTGPDALDYLQQITTNDVSVLQPGEAQYSMLPNPTGGVIDDIIVYRLQDEPGYFVVINAANANATTSATASSTTLPRIKKFLKPFMVAPFPRPAWSNYQAVLVDSSWPPVRLVSCVSGALRRSAHPPPNDNAPGPLTESSIVVGEQPSWRAISRTCTPVAAGSGVSASSSGGG